MSGRPVAAIIATIGVLVSLVLFIEYHERRDRELQVAYRVLANAGSRLAEQIGDVGRTARALIEQREGTDAESVAQALQVPFGVVEIVEFVGFQGSGPLCRPDPQGGGDGKPPGDPMADASRCVFLEIDTEHGFINVAFQQKSRARASGSREKGSEGATISAGRARLGSISDLARPVLRDVPLFDAVGVSAPSGAILAQATRRGAAVEALPVLALDSDKNEVGDDAMRRHILNPLQVNFEGRRYHLLAKRIHISSPGHEVRLAGNSSKGGLVIFGLLPVTDTQVRALSFPKTGLIALTALCALGVLFGIVELSSPPPRRRRGAEIALVTSVLAASSLGPLMFWDSFAFQGLQQRHDQVLDSLAADMASSVRRELEGVHRLIASDPKELEEVCDAAGVATVDLESVALVWSDAAASDQDAMPGYQKDKRSCKAGGSEALVSVRSREYYSVANQIPIDRPEPGRVDRPEPGKAFTVESVFSLTTAKNQAVMAVRSDQKGQLLAASFIPHSLIDVVMPFGYRFAVIEKSGRVLFHSDPYRNRNENLFVELADGGRLRGSVAAGIEASGDGLYDGRRYRYLTRPLEVPGMRNSSPWTLVVLRDRDLLDLVHLEALTIAGIGTVLVAGLLGLAMGGALLVPPFRKALAAASRSRGAPGVAIALALMAMIALWGGLRGLYKAGGAVGLAPSIRVGLTLVLALAAVLPVAVLLLWDHDPRRRWSPRLYALTESFLSAARRGFAGWQGALCSTRACSASQPRRRAFVVFSSFWLLLVSVPITAFVVDAAYDDAAERWVAYQQLKMIQRTIEADRIGRPADSYVRAFGTEMSRLPAGEQAEEVAEAPWSPVRWARRALPAFDDEHTATWSCLGSAPCRGVRRWLRENGSLSMRSAGYEITTQLPVRLLSGRPNIGPTAWAVVALLLPAFFAARAAAGRWGPQAPVRPLVATAGFWWIVASLAVVAGLVVTQETWVTALEAYSGKAWAMGTAAIAALAALQKLVRDLLAVIGPALPKWLRSGQSSPEPVEDAPAVGGKS